VEQVDVGVVAPIPVRPDLLAVVAEAVRPAPRRLDVAVDVQRRYSARSSGAPSRGLGRDGSGSPAAATRSPTAIPASTSPSRLSRGSVVRRCGRSFRSRPRRPCAPPGRRRARQCGARCGPRGRLMSRRRRGRETTRSVPPRPGSACTVRGCHGPTGRPRLRRPVRRAAAVCERRAAR
jgi:hypothetical protein